MIGDEEGLKSVSPPTYYVSLPPNSAVQMDSFADFIWTVYTAECHTPAAESVCCDNGELELLCRDFSERLQAYTDDGAAAEGKLCSVLFVRWEELQKVVYSMQLSAQCCVLFIDEKWRFLQKGISDYEDFCRQSEAPSYYESSPKTPKHHHRTLLQVTHNRSFDENSMFEILQQQLIAAGVSRLHSVKCSHPPLANIANSMEGWVNPCRKEEAGKGVSGRALFCPPEAFAIAVEASGLQSASDYWLYIRVHRQRPVLLTYEELGSQVSTPKISLRQKMMPPSPFPKTGDAASRPSSASRRGKKTIIRHNLSALKTSQAFSSPGNFSRTEVHTVDANPAAELFEGSELASVNSSLYSELSPFDTSRTEVAQSPPKKSSWQNVSVMPMTSRPVSAVDSVAGSSRAADSLISRQVASFQDKVDKRTRSMKSEQVPQWYDFNELANRVAATVRQKCEQSLRTICDREASRINEVAERAVAGARSVEDVAAYCTGQLQATNVLERWGAVETQMGALEQQKGATEAWVRQQIAALQAEEEQLADILGSFEAPKHHPISLTLVRMGERPFLAVRLKNWVEGRVPTYAFIDTNPEVSITTNNVVYLAAEVTLVPLPVFDFPYRLLLTDYYKDLMAKGTIIVDGNELAEMENVDWEPDSDEDFYTAQTRYSELIRATT